MSSPDYIKVTGRSVEIRVAVLPRSSACRIVGVQDNALKIKLTKPPVDGQANAECCRFLAKQLGVPRTQVTVAQGSASRRKVIRVEGVSAESIRQRLAALLQQKKS